MPAFLKNLSGFSATARGSTPEELEVLAKHASNQFHQGKFSSMEDAVVETVKTAALSPQQVRRVCEMANIDASLVEFRKEGRDNRFINLDNGPADPSKVLGRLNGRQTTELQKEAHHYREAPPAQLMKAAHRLPVEDQPLYKTAAAEPVPIQESIEPINRAYLNLVDAKEHRLAEKRASQRGIEHALDTLYGSCRDAIGEGSSLGQIGHVWAQFAPLEVIKVAFAHCGPRLIESRQLTGDQYVVSLEKVAHQGIPNPDHDLVRGIRQLGAELVKQAELNQELQNLDRALDECLHVIKTAVDEASGGATLGKALGAVGKGVGGLLNTASHGVGGFAGGLTRGLGAGEEAAGLAALAGRTLPYAAAGLGALHLVDRASAGMQANPVAPMILGPSDPYGGY